MNIETLALNWAAKQLFQNSVKTIPLGNGKQLVKKAGEVSIQDSKKTTGTDVETQTLQDKLQQADDPKKVLSQIGLKPVLAWLYEKHGPQLESKLNARKPGKKEPRKPDRPKKGGGKNSDRDDLGSSLGGNRL